MDFLVFLGLFLVFQQKSQTTQGFFCFPTETKKHRVFLVFHQRPNKKKKTLCFLFYTQNLKKNDVIVWISVGKPKNPRKTKKSKSFGPLRKFLIFGFWVFWFPPKAIQNQKSKTFLRGPKLLDFWVFLGFFAFPTEIQKNTWCFLVPKKHMVFWIFHQRPNNKTKNTLFSLSHCLEVYARSRGPMFS